MTHARDPLVVVEALRKALKGWTDYFDRLQQDALLADPNDPLIAMRDKLHGKRMNDSFDALALSATLPASERPSVEERVKEVMAVARKMRGYALAFGRATVDNDEDVALVKATRELEDALRRAIGGGE